jgi:hypothetical protein
MRYTSCKDCNLVIKNAIKDGWLFENSKGHPKLVKDGVVIRISRTPRTASGSQIIKRDLKKYGDYSS